MVKFGVPAGGLGAAAPLCVTVPTPFPSASSSQLESSLPRVQLIVPPAWLHMNTDFALTTDEQQGNVRMTNTDMHSRNPCCHRQAVSIVYAARVSAALRYPGRRAHAPCCVVICDLAGYPIFFKHYLINGTIFGKSLLSIKCVFLIFCTTFA